MQQYRQIQQQNNKHNKMTKTSFHLIENKLWTLSVSLEHNVQIYGKKQTHNTEFKTFSSP